MSFSRSASIRRIKPQRRASPLVRRDDSELRFVTAGMLVGRELLLDTSVYIDVLQGRSPIEMDQLLRTRITNHSTIALSELTHLFGALDPAHAATAGVLKSLAQTIDDIPQHRLSAPSARAAGEAGMLAGLVVRLSAQPNRKALLNDAMLFLHAAEIGCDLITGNVRDFDWFDQVVPGTGVLLYRRI